MVVKFLATVLLVAVLTAPVLAQDTPTPTPVPTIFITVQAADMYQFMATAAANVNAMPNDIQAVGGAALVPSTNAVTLFGYGKWLFSGNAAQELLGQTFAPIGINLFLILTVALILTTIYFVVYFAVLIIRAIVWLINLILKFIPFFG